MLLARSSSRGVLRTNASARTHPVWFAMAPGRVSKSASTASRTFTFLPCVPANSHSSSTARHHQGASSSPKDASRTSSIPPAPRSSTCHVETVPSTDVLTNQGNRASGSGSSSAASASTAPACAPGTRATTERWMCASSLASSRETPRATTCRARGTRVHLVRDREARHGVTPHASRVAARATSMPRRDRASGSVLARPLRLYFHDQSSHLTHDTGRRRPNRLTRDVDSG